MTLRPLVVLFASDGGTVTRGKLGLDRYGLRDRLGELGIQYISYNEYQRDTA